MTNLLKVIVTQQQELDQIEEINIVHPDGTQWRVTAGPDGKLVISGGLPVKCEPYSETSVIVRQI